MSCKGEPVQLEDEQVPELPRRLCSEIQLFDLCELEYCTFKEGRFCTNPDMLARFEAVAEPEDLPAQRFVVDDDEYTDEQEEDDDGYSVFDDEDHLEQDDE